MRILYLHQHFSTPEGAAGIRSYRMARRLVERGHAVTMVCGSYGNGKSGLDGPFRKGLRRGRVDEIDVAEFDLSYSNWDPFLKRSWTFLRFAMGSTRLALSEDYDVLCATTTPLTVGIPALAARFLRGKRYVFEVRDLWPELPKAMGVITNPVTLTALSVLERLSYRGAAKCIALAPGIAEGIAAHAVPAEKIVSIPNGCDVAHFAAADTPWRPPVVADDALLAVYTGTHGLANGLDAVLDGAAELRRQRRDDIRIALVGDGKCKPALQARARDEKLENVLFLDPVNKQRLASLLAGADIGLQVLADVPAFYFGTSPNKFFDYIAAGLPVLNNYPGWLSEMIVEEGCGLAVPPHDASAFADALQRAADDRSALARMGVAARSLAKRRFDRDQLAEEWVDAVTSA